MVYNSVAQSITSSTPTNLTFDVESFDTDGFHDAVNPDRLTIPFTGSYAIWANIRWEPNATGSREVYISIGGEIHARETSPVSAAGVEHYQNISMHAYLSGGGIVRVGAYQNSGGSLGIYGAYPFAVAGIVKVG